MRRHPVFGVKELLKLKGLDALTARIMQGAFEHHLNIDGSGYPRVEYPRGMSLNGRIVAIADCYDALTTTRTYQKSRHPSEAVRLIRRMSGKSYAPDLITNFVEMVGTYPVGELLRLASNELAVVASLNQIDATSPKVRIVTDTAGQRLETAVDADVAAEKGVSRLIVASVGLAEGLIATVIFVILRAVGLLLPYASDAKVE